MDRLPQSGKVVISGVSMNWQAPVWEVGLSRISVGWLAPVWEVGLVGLVRAGWPQSGKVGLSRLSMGWLAPL